MLHNAWKKPIFVILVSPTALHFDKQKEQRNCIRTNVKQIICFSSQCMKGSYAMFFSAMPNNFPLRLLTFLISSPSTKLLHGLSVDFVQAFMKEISKEASVRLLYKNGPSLASFLFIFGLFKQTIQFLPQINVKKCPSSIRRQDSNPQPLKDESSPITTRPGIIVAVSDVVIVVENSSTEFSSLF